MAPPRAASSRKSGILRQQAAARFQSKAEFLNPFEGDKYDEVAVLRYTGAWLHTTSTERRECMSSLVGRVLVTDSTPGSISRAHCLAAMVADYVEEKNISLGPVFPGTRAHMDKIPQGEPAPRTQKETGMRGNTAVRIRSRSIGQPSRRRSNQACVQCKTKAALAKRRLKSEGKHAAKLPRRYGSGQRIQRCMRQQPCAWNSEQPQQLLG